MKPVILALWALSWAALPAHAGPPRTAAEIQEQILRAEPGSTVTVPAGEYVLDRALVVSEKRDLRLVFDRNARILVTDTDSDVLRIEGSTGIRVEGGLFRHLVPRKDYACHGPVVRVQGGSAIEIRNADINGSGAIGIHADGVNGLLVEHNFIHENTFNALYLQGGQDIKIRANRIEANANLMQSYNVNGLEMSDNLIRDNGGYWGKKDPNPGIPTR